jgi:hypothetical protein
MSAAKKFSGKATERKAGVSHTWSAHTCSLAAYLDGLSIHSTTL